MSDILKKIVDKLRGTSGVVLFEADVDEFQRKEVAKMLKKRAKLVVK